MGIVDTLRSSEKHLRLFVTISALVLLADQTFKWVATTFFPTISQQGTGALRNTRNTDLILGKSETEILVIFLLTVAAILVIPYLVAHNNASRVTIPAGLLYGGILGNASCRMFREHSEIYDMFYNGDVVDFIKIPYIHNITKAEFYYINIADIGKIVGGALLLYHLTSIYFEKRYSTRQHVEKLQDPLLAGR